MESITSKKWLSSLSLVALLLGSFSLQAMDVPSGHVLISGADGNMIPIPRLKLPLSRSVKIREKDPLWLTVLESKDGDWGNLVYYGPKNVDRSPVFSIDIDSLKYQEHLKKIKIQKFFPADTREERLRANLSNWNVPQKIANGVEELPSRPRRKWTSHDLNFPKDPFIPDNRGLTHFVEQWNNTPSGKKAGLGIIVVATAAATGYGVYRLYSHVQQERKKGRSVMQQLQEGPGRVVCAIGDNLSQAGVLLQFVN